MFTMFVSVTFVEADRSMIGKGVEDVYNQINPDWLSRKRRGSEIDRLELEMESEAIAAGGKKGKKQKKSVLEVKYQEQESSFWATLNKAFTTEIPVPIEWMSFPENDSAIRDVMLNFLRNFIIPEMWKRTVSYPIKPAILCAFGVCVFFNVS